jgi:hypothetical protein
MSIFTRLFSNSTAPLRGKQEYLLELNSPLPGMKRVYTLTEELESDPKQVELTRALTLNTGKPQLGLKGTHGLFATEEWWNSINTRTMPLRFVSGFVVEAYEAGQDHEGVNNTVDVKLSDGGTEAVGIYTTRSEDISLFQPSRAVSIVYALDLLKRQSGANGGPNYCEIALEMLVSTESLESQSAA